MKHLIAILLLVSSLLTHAQQGIVVVDTSYFSQEDTTWYFTTYKQFSDGSIVGLNKIVVPENQVSGAIRSVSVNIINEAAGHGIAWLNSMDNVSKSQTTLAALYESRESRSVYMANADDWFEANAGDYEFFIDDVSQGAFFNFNRPPEPANVRFSRGATHYATVFLSDKAILVFATGAPFPGLTIIGLLKQGLGANGRPVWKSIDRRYEMRGQ